IFMAGVGWFRHAANKYHKIFYAVAALANIVTVILANSRGIFLGLVCAGLAIGVLLLLTSSREKVRKVGIGLIAAVVISGSGILAIHKQVWIKDVPVLKRFYKFTDNPRLRIWKVSLTGLKDRPFLGWGIENFQVVFDKYYDPLLVNDEEWFDRPHNLYLRTLIEGGLVTFAGLIALFGLIFWILLRGDDFPIGFKSVMIGFFVFFLVHNMFNFDTLASLIFINFFIAYVHYVWEKGRGFYFPRPVALGLALVVIPVTSVASMKVHHEERKSLYNFTKVILSAMGRKPRYFHERAKYFFENTYFLRRYGTLVFMLNPQRNLLYNKNVPAADKRRYTKLVLKEMEYILKEIPKTTRIYTLWGFFLNNVGQKERALEAYRVAKKLSPQKIKTIIYMTDVLLKLGKYEEAYQNLKEGFSWFPNYGPLNKHLALTSVLSRKTHDLLKLSPPVLMGALTQPNFQRAFLNTRQVPLYGKLLAEYLKTNPRSLPHLVNLSWAYNMVGQPEIAIKVIDQAVRYHPNYKTKASQIVSAIRQSQKNKAFKRPPKKK
ncbi:MAG: hypothetical protein HOM21_01130, partial [Halobacteriovoraceae bacterium]|nr:hypothetical protein [Halobacteriovoraceae bacterium]